MVGVGRLVAVGVLSLLAGAQVVRQAMVDAPTGNPAMAAAAWPGHPAVIFRFAMDRIGQRAAAGQAPDDADIQIILAAAKKAPLSTEPFLVRGVAAQVAGNDRVAGAAFAAAKRRDPRSLPTRYFLASYYERTGNARQGLEEISALLRLVPGSVDAVAPQLAAYARRPESRGAVKSLLLAHPELEPAILGTLAKDARNADLVLALSEGASGSPASRDWQARLVNSLVADGQYDKAQALWAAFADIPRAAIAQSAIFNADFADTSAPPPFNWLLASVPAGVAEYAEGGGLHIVYYGREPATLASQVVRIKPGRYRLAMPGARGAKGAKALSWKLLCLPDRKLLVDIPLDRQSSGPFEVPASGCRAQQIELVGSLQEMPETADLTVARLTVSESGR